MSAQSTSQTVHAKLRSATGRRVKALRRSGQLPAVLYGNVESNQNLELDAHSFAKVFTETGYSTLIDLVVDEAKPIKVLVHDASFDPIHSQLRHVDFYAVNLKEKLQTEVPLEFTGIAPAVEIDGGIFVTVKDSLEIECLPEDLPREISIDISTMKSFDDVIRIKDLSLPKGVTITADPEDVIASITEPISEEELAALDEAPAATVETEFETDSGTETPVAEGETAPTDNQGESDKSEKPEKSE